MGCEQQPAGNTKKLLSRKCFGNICNITWRLLPRLYSVHDGNRAACNALCFTASIVTVSLSAPSPEASSFMQCTNDIMNVCSPEKRVKPRKLFVFHRDVQRNAPQRRATQCSTRHGIPTGQNTHARVALMTLLGPQYQKSCTHIFGRLGFVDFQITVLVLLDAPQML